MNQSNFLILILFLLLCWRTGTGDGSVPRALGPVRWSDVRLVGGDGEGAGGFSWLVAAWEGRLSSVGSFAGDHLRFPVLSICCP